MEKKRENVQETTFDKKTTVNILLFTGFIQILCNLFILPRFHGNISLIRKIMCVFIVFPGGFLSLLANSGMSSVPAKRTLYDIIVYHIFQVPGFIIINLIYYFGKQKSTKKLNTSILKRSIATFSQKQPKIE